MAPTFRTRWITKYALSLLLELDRDWVVTPTSNLGHFTSGHNSAYRLSGVGLAVLTAYLHGEHASQGLIANAASPGWVGPDMGGPNANRSPAEGADIPLWFARFRPGSPGGRFWKDREPIEW